MIVVLVLSAFLALVSGRPSDIVPQNVVTVPPNCPPGQEWVNGSCRDVWNFLAASVSNVITAPPNCPPGQEFVNGACREVWIKAEIGNLMKYSGIESQNVVTVPANCKADQQWVNGACRDVWRSNYGIPKNVITVPPNCPPGQGFINGACRDVWIRVFGSEASENLVSVQVVELSESDRNVISVPNQCPAGYKPDALGVCREIFS